MNSGQPAPHSPEQRNAKKDETPKPSRFIDEKISDENDSESQADSTHKPTGLSNPFWN